MKKIIFLFTLVLSTSCLADAESSLSPVIKSWEKYNKKEISVLNDVIKKAHKNNQKWIIDPNQYVFNLFSFYGISNYKTRVQFDNGINPTLMILLVTLDVEGDDSLRSHIYEVQLNRNKKDKIWKIIDVQNAYKCWRSENTYYTDQICL